VGCEVLLVAEIVDITDADSNHLIAETPALVSALRLGYMTAEGILRLERFV
jgi:hypothetical protein